MSSKRLSLPLPRFTKSDLQKVLSSKSKRRSAAASNAQQYESLEARQLLTADILNSFPTVNDSSGFNSAANPPNITAAVGENHIVQFVNDGYAIYNKADGSLITPQAGGPAATGTLESFFTFASRGVGIAQDPVGQIGNVTPDDQLALRQPKLVYDTGFDRWYVTALSNEDFNGGIPGLQASRVYLAASLTPDPTGPWKSARLQLTSPTLVTGDLDRNISNVNLTVDEVGLTISARQPHPGEFVTIEVPDAENGGTVETDVLLGFGNNANPRLAFSPAQVVASIPQVALFGGDIEANRFEIIEGVRQDPDDDFDIDPSQLDASQLPLPVPFNLYPVDGEADGVGAGYDVQFGLDSTIDPQTFPVTSRASLWSLAINSDPDGSGNAAPDNSSEGTQIVLTEFTRPGLDGNSANVILDLEQGESTRIEVPFFRQPDVVRQPGDILRDRSQTLFNASVVQEGNFLYAVHSVRGGTNSRAANSALRWYKVDIETRSLVDSGQIEGDVDTDYINPSIDVSPNGTVAIGYTATGLNLNPSSFVSIGVPASQIDSRLVFNDPTELKAGGSTFFDRVPGFQNHFWGRYTTTVVDPSDPNSFWTFQQYTDADNNWAVQATQVGPSNTTPTIDALPADLDNIIEINQVGDNIEVVIDGDVVGVFDSDGIGTLTVNGNGGFDQFIVNVPDLNSDAISGSYILNGDGNDTLRSNATSDTFWSFDGGNGVTVSTGSANRILASGMVEFYSGAGNDRFEFPTSNYDFPVFGGEGNDTFVVGQDLTGDLQLFGEAGDDDYRVPASSFAGISISDSVGSENDQLTTSGTDGQDVIDVGPIDVTVNGIRVPFDDALNLWGVESFGVDALADDDTFNITSTTSGVILFGQRGDDTFNIVETSAMTGASEVDIVGGDGANVLNVFQNDAIPASTVSVRDQLIVGMSSADIQFGATGTFSVNLNGSENRSDVFEIVGVEAGNDLKVLGRAFDDQFIFQNAIDGTAELLGGEGNDRYETNVTSIFDVVITDSDAEESDVLYVEMTAGDDVVNVSELGYEFNGVAYPTLDAGFSGIEDFQIDGVDGNDVFNISSTTTPASYLGSGGDDQFFVSDASVTMGSMSMSIDGGTGSNELFVSRSAILGGAVAGTEIQIEDNMIVGMTIAAINYVATDGIFSRIDLQGSNGVDGDVLDDVFRVNTLADSTLLTIDGLGGNDLIHVRAVAEGDVQATGSAGDDSYIVALGGPVDRIVEITDAGDNGDDRLDVFFSDADEVINVLNNNPGGLLSYSVGTSAVNFEPAIETLALHALGGNDRYVVTDPQSDNLIMAGGEGDDTYDIDNVFGSTMVTIIDSVDAENDRLTVSGTAGDDVFDINENSFLINGNVFIADSTDQNIVGIESIEINALDGDDTFNVNSATRGFRLLGGSGADRFVVNDTAADAGFDVLEIDGGEGTNLLEIQRIEGTETFAVINETTIDNVAKARINYTATGGTFDGGNGGISIFGLDSSESFLVFGMLPLNSLQLHGLGGNDYHRVETSVQGDVWMDGGEGVDRYVMFMDETKSRSLRVADSGAGTETDRINFFLTENSDEVVLSGPSVSVMGDTASFAPTIETIEILAGDGDDDIDLQQFDGVRFLRIKGQNGNDKITVDRAEGVENIFLIGDAGNDTLELTAASQNGYLSASGNDGNDVIRVSEDFYRNSLINGGAGDDRYDVSFADRGRRRLRMIDTGEGGNDTAVVRGTSVANQLTLRASGITTPFQLIATTRQLESLEVIGTSGRDLVTMFAAPVANMTVNTLTGSDILELNSNNGAENLVFDLGAERDVANIRATTPGSTTTINLGRDDDQINVGSTFAEDNGNLDAIQGALTIDLGQGSDRLYLNDASSMGLNGYTVTDSIVENRDSVRLRPNFAGISYSGAEFLNLKGNVQQNTFVVTPSQTVRFLFDGNAPNTNELTVTGSDDGRELFETGEFSGIWLFDSFREIQFEKMVNV